MTAETGRILTWVIAGLAAVGVLVRPFRLPEAVWAVAGAALLVLLRLLSPGEALTAIGRGADVYLFLAGMMLLSETARREGLFDVLAAWAVNRSRGSPRRLFMIVYAAGVGVTLFLSNDATAVVLTPAVFAATRRAGAKPLPHLFACALVANAASFALPIANPANIVLYGDHTPPLIQWLSRFALPSLAAVVATAVGLLWVQRSDLRGRCEAEVAQPAITLGGWAAIAGLLATIVTLLTLSVLDRPLGLPTFILGAATAALVLVARRASPLPLLGGISWSILPLVGGLFVLVEGLDRSGVIGMIAAALGRGAAGRPTATAWAAGGALAVGSNLINNLPAGLVASAATLQAHPPRAVVDALLIGVDLGPNLSITGSLATLLWLTAIRREGEDVSAWRFLKVGVLVMPPALILALAARLALP